MRLAAVTTLSLLLAGIAIGAVAVSASQAPSAAAGGTPDLNAVSRWSGDPFGKKRGTVRILSGSLRDDPGRGVVLVQTPGLQPAFFSTPDKTGALRLSSASDYTWVFRSSRGSLVVADAGNPYTGMAPSFTFLGRQLNPDKLGPIGSRGVAVSYGYGPWKNGQRANTDVVLVERVKDWPGWKLYGYLPGFTLPREVTEAKITRPLLGTTQELQQPLRGPDGRLYSIDAKRERLVPGRWHDATRSFSFGSCTTWPAQAGASYVACPNDIDLRQADGSRTTLLRRSLGKVGSIARSWVYVQPSPNRKWLLTQDAYGACGLSTWAYFLPSRGGQLTFAFPGAYTSEALGWLPDNTALVAAQAEGCEGATTSGIYQITPGDPIFTAPPQLIFPGYVFNATTWGFGFKPSR
jgi:hypothetical protein